MATVTDTGQHSRYSDQDRGWRPRNPGSFPDRGYGPFFSPIFTHHTGAHEPSVGTVGSMWWGQTVSGEPDNSPPSSMEVTVIFNLRTAAFKAYCAIWVRRSNFRHQTSPRVSPLENTQRRKVELWARNVRKFCLNADFHVTFKDLLHAVKLRHETDGFTSPPKEGVVRIFSP
jgi:hypothetical protein